MNTILPITYSLCLAAVMFGLASQSQAAETTRVSVASNGAQANQNSFNSSNSAMSADGRFVVFTSYASNLVSGDTNQVFDVFVYDRQNRKITRASVDSYGIQADNNSYYPQISADGRFVVYSTYATNLDFGDVGFEDVFIYDQETRKTERVSVNDLGIHANADSSLSGISSDGRYVAFQSKASNLISNDTNAVADIFVRDRQNKKSTRVSVSSSGVEANDDSLFGSLSANGRYVLLNSFATNLVAGDGNGKGDVFVHDRQTAQTNRVSISSSGLEGNGESTGGAISADGRYVVFDSRASNLVSGDSNGASDVFVHDRQTRTTVRVSVDSNGKEGNFDSYASSMSADGRYITMTSVANNLVAGDANGRLDVFIHDRQTRQTRLVSVDSNGLQGNSHSESSNVGTDGRYVVFRSLSSNLVVGDSNSSYDIFVQDRYLDKSKTADLKLSVTQKPVSIVLNNQASFTYQITNNGPNAASGVSLTHFISKGNVAGFTPSQGSCKRYATISLCQLGTLNPGQSLTVRMNVKAAEKPSIEQTASVGANAVDANLGNNRVKTVTPVN